MQRDLRKYLTDIIIQINNINDFLGTSPEFTVYDNDLMIQYAVERALGIVGEAANQIRKIVPDAPISSLHQIVSLRNMLIHAYDGINNAIIWSVVINHLPLLQIEIHSLLDELNADESVTQ